MENKVELSVETTKRGRRIFFQGKCTAAALFHRYQVTHHDKAPLETWELVLYNSKFVAFRGTWNFYPLTLVQQLAAQGLDPDRYELHDLDLEAYQDLLDQNTKVKA
jgi:hypothetical protein